MTPLRFEQLHEAEWIELETALDHLLRRRGRRSRANPVPQGERVASLYRRTCEHLALARSRSYPAHLVDRLERVTADGHQVIYQRRELGFRRLHRLIAVDFPRAVRAQARYVWLATLVFALPLIVSGLLVHAKPDLILSVASVEQAAAYEEMYSTHGDSIGRLRTADTDWAMFGFYIRNNIGIAFQCFAGGLFFGLGTLFFLAYNGVAIGSVAGFLAERGLAVTFFSFVATHSAFELTAIVLSGAAGLRIGQALIAPGRMRRREALVHASRGAAVILYGVVAMLLIAATIEAFWSSAQWMPPAMKFAVAGASWVAMLCYLSLQGRHAD
jgi:uncharacterized membrane protein SpoIIM required for sporulation